MKKLLLSTLMIGLLCACDTSVENDGQKIAQWRENIGDISCTAIVSIIQENAVSEYELTCDCVNDNCKVTVVSPENIAGISASRDGKDTMIEYDGLMLSLGEIDEISPINALPEMIEVIKSGHLSANYKEENDGDDLIVLDFSIDEENILHIWCSADSMTPIHAEFENNGYAVVKAKITNWNLG